MKHRQISATEFKAKCLALLDEVEREGGSITVTKRGKPVATVRAAPKKRESSRGMWKGMIEITGDIVNFNAAADWEAFTHPELILHPELRHKYPELNPKAPVRRAVKRKAS